MMFEAIEPRRLMSAVTAVLDGTTLFVGGTNGADTIVVNKAYAGDNTRVGSVGTDGALTQFGFNTDSDGDGLLDGFVGVTKVVLLVGGGDDALTVTIDGADAVVLGGDGNDSVDLFASGDSAGTDRTNVFVDLGAGDDSILADVRNNSAAWVVAGDGLDRGAVVALDGGGVYVAAGNDDDGLGAPWELTANGLDAVVMFNGGNGDDWATANVLNGGTVVADGGNGSDHLNVGIVGSNGEIYLNGGNGTDTFEETTTVDPDGTVTLNGGNGSDTLIARLVDGTIVIEHVV